MQTKDKISVIIGFGEVGRALFAALEKVYRCLVIDPPKHIIPVSESIESRKIDILHICFPYFDDFVEQVRGYQERLNPEYTVIHSTVRPGTSRECSAIHSPVIGMHPHLIKSLLTFTKFLGGEQAQEVADYFRKAGMKVYLFDKPETTEVMKILDTTFYGLSVEYTKNVWEVCRDFDIPFEAWTLWTDNYNKGYEKLGHPEFSRPNLVPIMKKLGGHCILPNTELLQTKFTKFLKELGQ